MLFISVADGGMISKVLNFGNVKIRNRSNIFCFGLMVIGVDSWSRGHYFTGPALGGSAVAVRWQCGGSAVAVLMWIMTPEVQNLEIK